MSPEELRQQIRTKYKFPDDKSDEDISRILLQEFERTRGAWRNENARSAARKAYVMSLPDTASPGTFQQRVNESKFLLDPDTRAAMPLLADAIFLKTYTDRDAAEAKPKLPRPAFTPPFGAYHSQGEIDAGRLQNLNDKLQYLADNHEVISSGGVAHPDHRSFLMDSLDPESYTGWGLERMGQTPNAYRMALGGELPMAYGVLPSMDAMGAAGGNISANEKYRPFTATPVMDMPDDTPREEVNAERQRVQSEQRLAAPPQARERYMRTTGWNPPDWLAFASDVAVDYLDPSVVADFAFPVLGAVKRAARAAKTGGMSLAKAGKSLAADAAWEVAPDVGIEAGFGAALAGEGDPTYEGGSLVKSQSELEKANDIRKQNELSRLPDSRTQFYNWARDEYRNPSRKPQTNAQKLLGGLRN